MESQPRLLDQMREILRLKHRSVRTEEASIGWVKRFMLFHDKRHPKDMGTAEIRALLASLARHAHGAASTQHGALNALLLLYRDFYSDHCHTLSIWSGPNARVASPRSFPAMQSTPYSPGSRVCPRP